MDIVHRCKCKDSCNLFQNRPKKTENIPPGVNFAVRQDALLEAALSIPETHIAAVHAAAPPKAARTACCGGRQSGSSGTDNRPGQKTYNNPKKTTMYRIYDSAGGYIRTFRTYREASEYKQARGNSGWTIRPVSISFSRQTEYKKQYA